MELILTTDNAEKAAEVIALAKKLNISVKTKKLEAVDSEKAALLNIRLLAFQVNKVNSDSLSSLMAGSIDKHEADKLNQELVNMRLEWQRDIC